MFVTQNPFSMFLLDPIPTLISDTQSLSPQPYCGTQFLGTQSLHRFNSVCHPSMICKGDDHGATIDRTVVEHC